MNRPVIVLLLLAIATPPARAGLLDFLKPAAVPGQTSAPPASSSLAGLSQDQMVGGLKEALGKGVQQAVGSLGKEDGFLKDAGVKIPMPQSLQKVEKTLRALHRDKLADDFVTTMNRAAEKATP